MTASGFFPDPADDDELESRNAIFWDALLQRIRSDGFPARPRCVLDVGCHRGGLLSRIAQSWGPDRLIGIEPLEAARTRARLRLSGQAREVDLIGPESWGRIGAASVDLIVCHEVLFLIPNLPEFIANIARVLTPSGRAYVVAGCHAENPVWPTWRAQIEKGGVTTFTHEPIEVLRQAGIHRLVGAVRPLRDGGWATFDPGAGTFTFPTVEALLDHQFRHKLVFRLVRT